MFVVICKARVQPDKVELYEATFRALRETVLANEPGIAFYELCRVPDQPCHYRVVEAYADAAAQELHVNADYYRQSSAVIIDCLENQTFEMETVETI